MPRIDVTQDAVLTAVVTRLRDFLGLSPRQCFEVLVPENPAPLPPSGDYFVGVAPGSSQFPEGEQIPANCTEEWEIVVTVYVRMRLDDANRDTHLLHDPRRGFFALKRKILQALVGKDLTDAEGNTFLRQWTYARAAARPAFDREKSIGWWSLYFGISWDWDLVS